MLRLEKRLAALEAAQPVDPFRFIRLEQGETEQEARHRLGIAANAENVWFIERSIVSPGRLHGGH